MADGGLSRLWRWLKQLTLITLVLVIVVSVTIGFLWQTRPALEELGWPLAESVTTDADAVTVTWLGVSTLLFDDGETQLLIDGFFSRPGPLELLFGRISTDVANVNFGMSEYRMSRLAAIIPVHSHFDHAMDVGFVANRSSAVVLGSESTANIVIGTNLPVQQYQILADREVRQFGNFMITLIVSEHAPIADGESPMFPGIIERPLQQPAYVGEWKEGTSYSVVIEHPRGTALVQGSAGFVTGALADVEADAVFLGVAGIAGLGNDYAGRYWRETVQQTGAGRVYPVHYDDFTQPLGEIGLFPAFVDDMVQTADWLREIGARGGGGEQIERLPYGQRIAIY